MLNISEFFDGRPHWIVLNGNGFGPGRPLYDVLTHPYIVQLCRETGRRAKFATFESNLLRVCLIEFSGRAQYEMGMTDKFPHITAKELDRLKTVSAREPDQCSFEIVPTEFTSIDVYVQLRMNWSAFSHYVFNHRAAIVKSYEDQLAAWKAKLDMSNTD